MQLTRFAARAQAVMLHIEKRNGNVIPVNALRNLHTRFPSRFRHIFVMPKPAVFSGPDVPARRADVPKSPSGLNDDFNTRFASGFPLCSRRRHDSTRLSKRIFRGSKLMFRGSNVDHA